MSGATARPWRMIELVKNRVCVADSNLMVICSGKVSQADEFNLIVRAVNSHDALVLALRKLCNEVEGCAEMARECIGNTNASVLLLRLNEARDALALAEEKA